MTSDQTFEDLDARLSSDAINLFTRMVETHLAHRADAGDNLFLMPTDFAGELWFTGQKSAYTPNVRSAALNDLSSLGLLQRGSPRGGGESFTVSGTGENFFQWLKRRNGTAIDQVAEVAQRNLSGAGFAERNPGASKALDDAFELLWESSTDDQAVQTIGGHLRTAIQHTVSTVIGPDADGKRENPIGVLKDYGETLELTGREVKVLVRLVELAGAVLSLDQRLHHILDEVDKDRPPASWDEMRRATSITAVTCIEIDLLRPRR